MAQIGHNPQNDQLQSPAPQSRGRQPHGLQAADNPVPIDERLMRWLKRAAVIGVVVSLVLHLSLWFVSAHLPMGHAGAASEVPMPGVVDFAVMTQTELADLQADAELTFDAPSVPEIVDQTKLPEIESLDMPTESDITGTIDQIAPTEIGAGAGDIGNSAGLGEGGGSGSGSASFFGVEATGSRFIYIIDVSGSMAVGGKLQALQQEMVKSIEGLTEAADFFIITYSSGATPLQGRAGWIHGDQRGKRFARRGVSKFSASGGTNPSPAFSLAFAMRPPPDALYFMTDGEFNEEVASEIAMLNSELKIPIHCIAFVSRDSERVMRKIASDSGGTYTFVPAPSGRSQP